MAADVYAVAIVADGARYSADAVAAFQHDRLDRRPATELKSGS
jgi:hypothetical protein